jgi:hypothetical protein
MNALGLLLAMMLFAAAWIATFAQWDSIFWALVTPLR